MNTFWSSWIIVLTVVSFIGITWLLLANRKGGEDAKTGHVYDGIEEYDNPLPAWWMYLFMGTIIFGAGYIVVFPGLGSYPGLIGWTSINQWEKEVATAEERYGEIFARYSAMPVTEVASDRKALKMGRRIFANNCAQCHGSDARGSFGFPNLADDQWLYGGSVEAIKTSISEGRIAAMPPWFAALGEQGVKEVSAYVVSLSGREADAGLLDAGKQKYQMFCASCHGVEGKGNPVFGAPNLSDDTWLYGGTMGDIQQSIRDGRNGRMPPHKELLSKDKIHVLTAYVYSLSAQNEVGNE